MSNMLKLVHLLPSKSLLVVLDEFDIVSQMCFIIIQLLYAIACVAVSTCSLLKSVLFHESNTSSCHFATAS